MAGWPVITNSPTNSMPLRGTLGNENTPYNVDIRQVSSAIFEATSLRFLGSEPKQKTRCFEIGNVLKHPIL
jgi:hypothetical protein